MFRVSKTHIPVLVCVFVCLFWLLVVCYCFVCIHIVFYCCSLVFLFFVDRSLRVGAGWLWWFSVVLLRFGLVWLVSFSHVSRALMVHAVVARLSFGGFGWKSWRMCPSMYATAHCRRSFLELSMLCRNVFLYDCVGHNRLSRFQGAQVALQWFASWTKSSSS